jgi:rhomboid protease GluP
VGGALLTSTLGYFGPVLPGFLRGSPLTIGASGAIFGLAGALLYYGRRGGSSAVREVATRWIIFGLIFGFAAGGAVGRVDNWCHLGGLASGYLMGRWLDPLKPERGDHAMLAILCLVASALSIAASLLVGLPPLR